MATAMCAREGGGRDELAGSTSVPTLADIIADEHARTIPTLSCADRSGWPSSVSCRRRVVCAHDGRSSTGGTAEDEGGCSGRGR